jgi:lantibiotic modifying enzyme
MLIASATTGETAWHDAAVQAALRGLGAYENGELPWPPGVNGGTYNPSLMLGEAGVGWFLLRCCAPDQMPSVLMLS